MKTAQPAPKAVWTSAMPRYSCGPPLSPSVRNHGSIGMRMICTGTIIVVMSRK